MVRYVHIEGDPTPPRVTEQAVLPVPADPNEPPADPTAAIIDQAVTTPEPGWTVGFFNPQFPQRPSQVVLEQHIEGAAERFRVIEPIGFWDPDLAFGIIVPDNLGSNKTDLTSVPRLFTWLVGRSGPHSAAAIVHDSLVTLPLSYVAPRLVKRHEADAVFRNALASARVPVLRRWVMYAAVTGGTMIAKFDPDGSDDPDRQRRKPVGVLGFVALLLSILVLGTMATIDLLDGRDLLPWMGDRSTTQEAVNGFVMALLAPLLLALTWLPRWRAGVIAGWALALLLHVTIALVIVSGVYFTLESLRERDWKTMGRSLAVLVPILVALWLVINWGFSRGWPQPR
jgi:hypothetical protein